MNDLLTYIVTGATGGIGKAIVAQLTKSGKARIVMAVRNPQRAMDYANSLPKNECAFQALPLDLADFASVDAFVQKIKDENLKIDTLINNAGLMPGKIEITGDGYESAMQINYLSTKRLTDGLLPCINDGGAIVFTTSVTRYLGNDRADAVERAATRRCLGRRFVTYGQSKRLITRYAHALSKDLGERLIRVNCADPGIADTGMISMGNKVVDYLANLIFRPIIYTPQQGATPALRAVASKDTGYIFTLKKMTKNNL